MTALAGRKGLIIGIANEASLAWGCARAFHEAGAELAVTCQNDKARAHVAPLAERLGAPIFMPLDVTNESQWYDLEEEIRTHWDHLDFALHSVAYAPKADLQGRVTDCSQEGFAKAMQVSAYSFIRMARMCEKFMAPEGGALLTLSFYGAHRVVENYNIMGPVKAALEAAVREVSMELGQHKIRVNALSTGPVPTRAASGLAHFDAMMDRSVEKAPLHQHITLEDIGAYARFLVSDEASRITGQTLYVDAGYNISG